MCPVIDGEESEKEAVLQAAKLMLVSARTAPKSGGVDDVETAIVYGEEKDRLANEMEKIGEEREIPNFKRDAKNVRDSDGVVLIGVRGTKSFGLNCGMCGYESCGEFEKAEKRKGQDLNVDNRIMYRIGVAAKRLGMLPQSTIVIGVPLSAKGKNIYFDRR